MASYLSGHRKRRTNTGVIRQNSATILTWNFERRRAFQSGLRGPARASACQWRVALGEADGLPSGTPLLSIQGAFDATTGRFDLSEKCRNLGRHGDLAENCRAFAGLGQPRVHDCVWATGREQLNKVNEARSFWCRVDQRALPEGGYSVEWVTWAVVLGMSCKKARQLVKLLQKKSLHYIEVVEFDIFDETLKSDATVKVKDVLDRADMEEFITWYAKEKLNKLQRGSVKGFIAENQTIKSLNVFDNTRIDEIEKILQIRHLYTHQNGIVDDKFRQHFPAARVNAEYRMTLDEFLNRFEYLAEAVEAVDEEARKVFALALFS